MVRECAQSRRLTTSFAPHLGAWARPARENDLMSHSPLFPEHRAALEAPHQGRGYGLVFSEFLDLRQPRSNYQLPKMRNTTMGWEKCRQSLDGCDEAVTGGS